MCMSGSTVIGLIQQRYAQALREQRLHQTVSQESFPRDRVLIETSP